ncbi:MAG: hypothetical protein WCS94_21005 [Verrucomicrobiota bacterium]
MNSIEWLKSVREKGQKAHIPPDPPDGIPGENGAKPLIPPDAPCSFLYLVKNENIFGKGVDEEKEKNNGVPEEKVQTSGGVRGNIGFYEVKAELGIRGIRGNQGNSPIAEVQPAQAKLPLPFFTPGGDLSIPFGSDPKYHWWKPGGQSVEQTRREVQTRMRDQAGG